MFVVNTGNQRVDVFSPQGTFLRGFGQDVNPSNPSHGLEVCTTASSCQAGGTSGAAGSLTDADGIAVDANGTVYVVEGFGHRVSEFNSDGTFIRAFGKNVVPGGGTGFEICTTTCQNGTSGAAAGELSFPFGIALDQSGNVYVGDFNNNRIAVYGPTGAFERAFGWDVIPANVPTQFEACTTATTCKAGVAGAGIGQYNGPAGLAIDGAGSLFVADANNARIAVSATTGSFERAFGWDVVPGGGTGFEVCTTSCKIGLDGPGPGQLSFPDGVSVDPAGNVDVTDQINNRISTYTSQGAFVHSFGWDVIPGGGTGFEVCTSSCKAGLSGGGAGELNKPDGLAADCRGGIFVADSNNGRVQRFGETGTALPPCSTAPPPNPPLNDFSFGKPKLNKKKGTATLPVNLPGAGEVTLAGKNVKPLAEQVAAGETDLPIAVTGKAKRKLKKKGKFEAKVSISFTPTGGTAKELTNTYKLKRKRKR